jgi:WD40 repeat protein/serine/threonine protein kinase
MNTGNPANPASLDSDPLDQLAEAFLERLRGGERPALTEYTAHHPELAERIRRLFPALMVLEELGSVEGQAGGSDVARATLKGLIPTRLGEYRILREVGRGGMGIVYEAVQESLGRHVALKVLPFHSLLGLTRVERFRREAKAAARLHHTNIVPVFGVGEQDGIHYYAMQFISGQGVDDVLQEVRRLRGREREIPAEPKILPSDRNPPNYLAASVAEGLVSGQFPDSSTECGMENEIAPRNTRNTQEDAQIVSVHSVSSVVPLNPPPTPSSSSLSAQPEARYFRSVAEIGVQVADALAYAHKEGVLHRDVKPSNLLLDTSGRVWITDFGLAKAEDSDDLTQTGDMVGTLSYMAPERLQGQADPRSDVYGLGVTLYEMLTLQPAFTESNRARLMERIAYEEPKPPRSVDSRIPRDMETIVLKAMSKDPSLRYASAEALGEDLRRLIADRPIRARRVSFFERAWRWCRRNPAVALATSLAMVALVASAILGFSLAIQQHQAAMRLEKEQNETISALGKVRVEKQQKETALDEAEKQKRAAERLSTSYALEQGISLCEQGDVALGLSWMAHSLQIAPEHAPELQRAIRANMGAWSKELRSLKGLLKHEDAVFAIAYSPDGELLLTGGWEMQARLWNVKSGTLIGRPLHQKGYIWSVAFSPDGRRFAISGDGGTELWDLPIEGHVAKPLNGLKSSGPVAFSPDGQILYTATGKRGKIQRWDAATGDFRGEVCAHDALVYCLAVSPNGQTIVTGGEDNCARLWDSGTGKAQGDPIIHPDFVHAAIFSHDGSRLLTGSYDGFARLWGAATLEPLGLPLPHHDKIRSVAFGNDDRSIITGSSDGMAQIWDAETCQPIGPPLKHRGQVRAVAFSPKGSSIATAGDENVVRLWDWRQESSNSRQNILKHESAVRGLAVSPNGRDLLTSTWTGETQVWDLSTTQIRGKPFRFASLTRGVAFSPDGSKFLVGSHNRTARLFDSTTLKPIGEPITLPEAINAIAFSPDCQSIILGDWIGQVWRKGLSDSGPASIFSRASDRINGLAWSPDGKYIAAASHNGRSAELWDARTGKPVGSLKHADAVWAVAFCPDSRLILTGSWDGTARLWDVTTLKPKGAPLQHGAKVEAVAISPDGHTVVTGGLDGRARLWDADTGIPIGPPLIHRDMPEMAELLGEGRESRRKPDRLSMVVTAAFHPDGHSVMTGALDSTARIWPVPEPIQGSPTDLLLQTRLLTGLQLEPGGAAVLLDAETWSGHRQISFYTLQMAFAPFHPGPVSARARAYSQLGQFQEAVDDWTTALRLCSRISARQDSRQLKAHDFSYKLEGEIHAFRGRAYWRLGKMDEAAEDYQKAVELEFHEPWALNTLAWMYVMGPDHIRDAARALPLARRAVAFESKNKNYVNTLGVVYYRLGMYSEAIPVLENNGSFPPAMDWFPLAASYAFRGELAKAQEAYERADRWLGEHREQISASDAGDLQILRADASQALSDGAKNQDQNRGIEQASQKR